MQNAKRRLRAAAMAFSVATALLGISAGPDLAEGRPQPAQTPPPQAAVINLTVISAERAATVLRGLFPHARIRVDAHADAVIVVAPPDDVQQIRTIVQGIDVRNPQTATTDVVPLHVLKPQAIVPRLRALYPNAHIEPASKTAAHSRGPAGLERDQSRDLKS
jgi:hypothetical protein